MRPLLAPASANRHVEACLIAIDVLDERVRAMITVTRDEATMVARQQDEATAAGRFCGALAGMTVTLKDVIHTAGIRTTNGSDIDRDFVPVEDAEVVRRLRTHGAIILGKANLHEYAYGGTTQNPFYGSCRNPWDLTRIPGGSSGGSGAAVASGMCDVSLGTDTAGSGRLPGALCSVTALRPTSGAISNRGITPVSLFFDTVSPMARRVVDVARVFSAIAGHDPGDPFSIDHPIADSLAALDGRLDGLRVGLPAHYFFEGVDPGVLAATHSAIAVIERQGAKLVEMEVPDIDEAPLHFERLFHTDCAVEHRDHFERRADRLGPDTRDRLEKLGRSVSGIDYAEALAWMRKWQWRLASTFKQIDAIMHPTTPTVAPTIAECASTTAATRRLAVFLYPWALAQVPVISVPCGPAEHGMPSGLSIVAPWWREDLLFRIGDALQRVTDWHLQQPELVRELPDLNSAGSENV